MIIVDGPDGAGKTTLCHKLVQDGTVAGYLESPSRTKGKLSFAEQTNRYLFSYIDRNLVVDRYLFSEMVYGPVMRGHCVFRNKDFFEILSTLIEHRNPIIFCLPESVKHLNLRLEQMPGVVEKIPEIFLRYQNYYSLVARMYSGVFAYDLNSPTSYFKVKEFLRERHGFQKSAAGGRGPLSDALQQTIRSNDTLPLHRGEEPRFPISIREEDGGGSGSK